MAYNVCRLNAEEVDAMVDVKTLTTSVYDAYAEAIKGLILLILVVGIGGAIAVVAFELLKLLISFIGAIM